MVPTHMENLAAMVSTHGNQLCPTKVTFSLVFVPVLALGKIRLVMYMSANSNLIKRTATANIHGQTAIFTKETSSMT